MYDECIERFAKRGIRISGGAGYGMTETSEKAFHVKYVLPLLTIWSELGGIITVSYDDMFERNAGAVGSLLSNLEGRLVGEGGEDVPEGDPGELWLRGPNIAKCVVIRLGDLSTVDPCQRGYLNNPTANSETFTPDHWLKTGDIVVRNAEGVLWIVDRKKELIKYKGFQGECYTQIHALPVTHI